MSRGSLEKSQNKKKKTFVVSPLTARVYENRASPGFPVCQPLFYLYAAITVAANQTQPADKPNHKIDFSVSLIFLFPLFNIF